MPTPIPRQDYLVEVQQISVRTYRVSAESLDDAKSRYPDGLVINSETGPATVENVALEATDL